MSNVKPDRHVEDDWWSHPIPSNVEFGEGFYCESAQVFRKLRSRKPRAVIMGQHVSCYAGCSFSIGEHGQCIIGDFTLLNGALIMAEEKIEIGSHCLISWNVGIADSDFHPLDPAQRLVDAQALAPYLRSSAAPKIENRSCENRGQCLDRHERGHFERRHIGANCVVAAGSVVTKSVEPNTVVAGNPAVVVKQFQARSLDVGP